MTVPNSVIADNNRAFVASMRRGPLSWLKSVGYLLIARFWLLVRKWAARLDLEIVMLFAEPQDKAERRKNWSIYWNLEGVMCRLRAVDLRFFGRFRSKRTD